MNLSRDYISGLPDELLTSIISLVGTKEAVQSCLLAKRWRKPWTFVPFLKFDLNEFLANDVDVNKKERRMECEDKFKLFVNSVLENRGTSSVDSIQYKSMISDNCSEASMQWLDRAVLLMPRVISVSVERYSDILDFPNSVFSCASLEKLELNFNTQERTIINPMYISLPALKCLDLCGANIDDEFLHNLFSGCPSLESMVLHVCDIVFTGICPLSSNVLKELALHQCWHTEHIQISCPCLDSLVIDCDGEGGGISLENMVSLTNAEFRFSFSELDSDLSLLKGLSNVSTLRLEFLDAEFQRLLEYDMLNCTTFNNLKSLKIARWDASSDFDLMACFIKHSPSLQEIILDLSERQKYILEEEPNQEELHEVLFQREHIETIRIRRSGNQDVFVNRLINNFCAHIKNIGKIIVS